MRLGKNKGGARKDREWTHDIVAHQAQILVRRSSSRPIDYAIILRVFRDGAWQAVISADNSHEHDGRKSVASHHYHRYIDGVKQEAEPLPFSPRDVNEAMSGVVECFRSRWKEFATPP